MGPFSEQVEEGIGPSALPIQFAGARRGETSCPRFALFCNPWSALPSMQSADKAYAAPLPFFCKCAHNGFMMLPLLLGQRATGGPASFRSRKGVALSAFRLPCMLRMRPLPRAWHPVRGARGYLPGHTMCSERACGRRRFCTLSVQQGRRTDSGRRTLTAQGRCPNARKNQKKSIDSAFYLWLYY